MTESVKTKAKPKVKAVIKSGVNTVSDIRNMLKNTKVNSSEMVELINVSFIADEDYILRKPNKEYIERELTWYLSQSLYVNDIPEPIPKIWKNVSSDKGRINSNYGWCIFSADNGYQYNKARQHLLNDISTRKAIMIYTRPSIQDEWNKDNMSDFICTNNVQLFIRDSKLIYIINQRSCDAVFGYPNDLAWHKFVYDMLLKDINEKYPDVISTPIEYIIGTLHVYPTHQNLLKDL